MNYTWTPAMLTDIEDMVKLCEDNFTMDNFTIDGIQLFKPEPPVYSRNLAYAIFNQSYYPGTELLTVARADDTGQLLAYNWARANDRIWYSDDAMINVRMVHLDMTLPAKLRVRLIKDMMTHWERMAHYTGNKVICSSTIRNDQDAFLRLHQRAGYTVRGSYAYKRIN